MKKQLITLIAGLVIATASAAPNNLKTKIVIQAVAQDAFIDDAPAFILYPEGDALKDFEESGAIKQLEKSIKRMGYTLVSKDTEAVVFIRVDFAQHEPFATEFEIKGRPKIDYSNAASTKNYAAMMKGGRYQQLADPQIARNMNDPASILGPTGEIIVLSEQEPNAPKVIDAESQKLQTMIHPITLQISAWSFEKETASNDPEQLWAVLATYNNLRDEEAQPQLRDLCKAASRFFGKNLKNEKLVAR
ncbi:hypothetical protein VDG1235_1060 [Verrucomicrobiia bacterium DG1235]|nr:hypothetical protein VDG1235_1060 [Verrucomicrobiae bacterium DG1235]